MRRRKYDDIDEDARREAIDERRAALPRSRTMPSQPTGATRPRSPNMIHPEALKRAQQKANVASRFQMDAGVYDRALLAAYLSDPEVRDEVAFRLPGSSLADNRDDASIILQAIGAEVSK